MKKIALLSSAIALGLFEQENKHARTFSYEKVASTADLSHFNLDYELLLKALDKQNLAHELVAWDDPNIDWSHYDLVFLHSPWDYYEHKDEFLAHLRRIEANMPVLNALDIVSWNSNKTYLQDLKRWGIPIIESTFIDIATTPDIIAALPNVHWEHGYIFKPTVCAGATDVFLIPDAHTAQTVYAQHYRNKHNTLLVQPFMKEISFEGEWSFIFFDGIYSHAVLKKTIGQEVLVKHSLENQHHTPTAQMIAQATTIYQRLEEMRHAFPLYTRIDVIKRADDYLCVMEIEQIEPYLYLHAKADAADKLVAGMLKYL